MKSEHRNYNFIDHTADIAVKLEADDFEGLLVCAAMAWKDSVIDSDPDGITENKKLEINSDSAEELLVSFVDEINFQLNVNNWLFESVEKIKINKNDSSFLLNALLKGKFIDPSVVELKAEIKAVTFHQMKIIYDNNLYSTMLVFDI